MRNKEFSSALQNEFVDRTSSKEKDPNFLIQFLNDHGKILPRRITGTSQKYQKKVKQAIKRARHLALLPFASDSFK